MPATPLTLGITVMPEFLQVEGVEPVLDRIADVAGATSITTAPSVMAPAAEGGAREPPIDGGSGDRRLLDRRLWGERALWVTTAPSFEPDPRLYAGLAYPPPEATGLTRREGGCVTAVLRAARDRGMQSWLQVMAASPPGVRVQFGGPARDDLAMPPDGAAALDRVDKNGSLASPAIRAFMAALIEDLARAYPEADGFKFDWPEYPPYELQSLLFDYNPAVAPIAARHGLDFDALRAGMAALLRAFPIIAGLGGSVRLAALLRERGLPGLLRSHPVLAQHFRLRALLVADYAAFLAGCVRRTGRKMFLQGFPPPWNELSGFDLPALDGVADTIGVKLYTMHWPMMERNYVERLEQWGGGTAEDLSPLVQLALATRDGPPAPLASIRYPDPDEPHPAADAAISAKVAAARAQVKRSEFQAIGHAYGPLDDVRRRLRLAAAASGGRVTINRYGYLDDAKLAMLGEVVRDG